MQPNRIIYTLGSLESVPSSLIPNTLQKRSQGRSEDSAVQQPQSTSPQKRSNGGLSSGVSARRGQYESHALTKTKPIAKRTRGKLLCIVEQKKQQSKTCYKYFPRKIVDPQDIPPGQGSPGFATIADWLMQACQNFHLSRDTFYTAVAIAKKCYPLAEHPAKSVDTRVACMLVLAAKLECNSIDFSDAVAVVCGLQRDQLIRDEKMTFQNLGYQLPIVHVQWQITDLCIRWTVFANTYRDRTHPKVSRLCFEDNSEVQKWSQPSRLLYVHYCQIADLVLLKLSYRLQYTDQQKVKRKLLEALFLLLTRRSQEPYPSRTSPQTSLTSVFREFAKGRGYEMTEFSAWLDEMIEDIEKLGLEKSIAKLQSPVLQSIHRKRSREDRSLQGNRAIYGQIYWKGLLN